MSFSTEETEDKGLVCLEQKKQKEDDISIYNILNLKSLPL